jgi:hypothetical protein
VRPTRGPTLYKVPGSDGLVLAVAPALGSPSVSATLVWRFPKPVFCDGFFLALRPGAVAAATQAARTSLVIVDETNQPIVSDSRGTLRGVTNAPVAAPLLSMFGRGAHPFPIQRPVAAQDQWFVSFQNEDPANVVTLAGLFLLFQGVL